MTCVVGTANQGNVWVGADSCAANHITWLDTGAFKLFRVGDDALVGGCGSFRVIDLVKYNFDFRGRASPEQYLKTEFIDKLFELCKKYDEFEGWGLLIGLSGELFEVQDDFSVLRAPVWGHAIGSGGPAARGSLFATKGLKRSTHRIKQALKAAEAVDPFTRGPFNLMKI